MGDNLPLFLANLPDHLFGLSLLFCRVSAAVMLVPGWGESETPAMVRIGLAASFSLVLYPPLASQMPAAGSAPQVVAMIASELAAGGLLGWLAKLVALALPAAGQFISFQMGLSSVLQPDAELGAQSAMVAQAFSRALPVLVLASGLYRFPLAALAGSYAVMPPGRFLDASDTAEVVVRVMTQFWALSLQLAAPFLFAGLLLHAGLGLVARLVPRVQIYSVAAPGQIIGGLTLLGILISSMLHLWGEQVGNAWALLPGH